MKLDTLSYANKLIAAGCERKLAEAHASTQQDVLVEVSQEYLSQFVTKEEFKNESAWVRQEFELVRKEFRGEFKSVRQEMENLGMSLTIRLGALMAILMTIGIAVLTVILKL